MINRDTVISELHLKKFGQKGWMSGDLYCPECGRNEKFGVLFTDEGGVCRCFFCGVSWSLAYVLSKNNRKELIGFDYEVYSEKELSDLSLGKTIETNIPPYKPPIGFKRINHHEYLEKRGFTNYEKYAVGISDLQSGLRGKLIFQIFQGGQPAVWIARSTKSKEWHKQNLIEHKEFGAILDLRYKNSNSDFTKILGGLDDITEQDHTLILVEGLFDKENVDSELELNKFAGVKCCFTFGDSIHKNQINLIPDNIETVILLYDANTIKNMRSAGDLLYCRTNLFVGIIDDPEKDPGNMSKKELMNILINTKDFVEFYTELS